MSMRYPAGFISAFYNPLKNPDAPIIGTATYGNASASVTFTAPTNVGGSAITGYTVVSTPSGITGTGASSPITVSGLSNGTAYTFTVFATNSYGPSALSAASNSVTPSTVPPIGSAYGGGYFAGQISTAGNGIADYNLVIGPKPSAQDNTWFLRPLGGGPGFNSVINGPANSLSMNSGGYAAAIFCEAVNVGGYTDWYMPASNELEICYYNLKPNTTANNTAGGANVNAVPSRASNYTSGTPSQTSATDFQTGGTQAFTALGYWSSTTDFVNVTEGRAQIFTNGNQYGTGKTAYNFVRAVRRVAV